MLELNPMEEILSWKYIKDNNLLCKTCKMSFKTKSQEIMCIL
jgi:hypothetical protein